MTKFTFSLRNILSFTFILLGGLPILIMGFITVKYIGSDMAAEVRSKNLLLAQSAASEVEDLLDNSLALFRQIEEIVIENEYVKGNGVNAYLEGTLRTRRDFDSLEILDEKGTVRFMAPMDRDMIGVNRSGQQFFSHAMEHRQPYWSPTFVSLRTGTPAVTLAIPVKGGLIAGYLDLASLNSITDRIKVGRQGYALVADQEGTIIAHPDRTRVSERQNITHLEFMSHRTDFPEGNFTYRDNGHDYLASLSRVPRTEWTVMVVVPVAEAFAPVARIRGLFATGAGVVIVLAALAVLVGLRKAANPISQLVRHARSIAGGRYRLEKNPSGCREIDELMDDFHLMAQAIESREEELKKSKETLQAVFDAVREGMVLIDREGTVILTNTIAALRLGSTPGGCIGTCLYDHLPPDMARHRKERHNEVITSGKPVSFEDTREGTYCEHHCYPVPDKEGRAAGVAIFTRDITEHKQAEEERERLILELREALAKVKILSGLLPICSCCKKIRNDKGYWEQMETYIRDHSEADFSHGICPECAEKLYGEYYKKE